MEHFKEVIIYNVPKSVAEKDLLNAVEKIVEKDKIKQSIPLPLPNDNNFSNYRLSFDSETLAEAVVKQEKLLVNGESLKVDYYRNKNIINKNVELSVVVEGFTGKKEELSSQFSEYGKVVEVVPNEENKFLVKFEDAESAKKAVEGAKTSTDPKINVRECTTDLYTSFTSSTSNRTASNSRPILSPSPTRLCFKGVALSYIEDEEQIKQLCAPYDKDVTVYLHADRQHPDRKVAFVEFSSEENAKNALNNLDKKQIPEEIFSKDSSKSSEKEGEKQTTSQFRSKPITVEYIKDKSSDKQSNANNQSSTASNASEQASTTTTSSSSDEDSNRPVSLYIKGKNNSEREDLIRLTLEHFGAHVLSCSLKKYNSGPWTCIAVVANKKEADLIFKEFNEREKKDDVLNWKVEYFKSKKELIEERQSSNPAMMNQMMYPNFMLPTNPYPMMYFGQDQQMNQSVQRMPFNNYYPQMQGYGQYPMQGNPQQFMNPHMHNPQNPMMVGQNQQMMNNQRGMPYGRRPGYGQGNNQMQYPPYNQRMPMRRGNNQGVGNEQGGMMGQEMGQNTPLLSQPPQQGGMGGQGAYGYNPQQIPMNNPNMGYVQNRQKKMNQMHDGVNQQYMMGPQRGQIPQGMQGMNQEQMSQQMMQQGQMQNVQQQQQQQQQQQPQQPQEEGINIKALETMSEDNRKETMGQYFYNRANKLYNNEDAAGKIAGMLLEFSFEDLRPCLADTSKLDENIREAHKLIAP